MGVGRKDRLRPIAETCRDDVYGLRGNAVAWIADEHEGRRGMTQRVQRPEPRE
jgi:hypothetical protein